MPKNKHSKKSESSDSDSGPDDRTPAKKQKSQSSKSKKQEKQEEDDISWTLSNNRFVKLTEFKGKWYVNIREYYTTNEGDLRPGKKGIMLTMEQWQKFKGFIGEIDDAIKQNV